MGDHPALPHLEITTDGGFTGRGAGGISIDGDTVSVSSPGRESCSGVVTAAERQALRKAVESFRPEDGAAAHPDQIGYQLTAGERKVRWNGEDPPEGVAPLFHAMWSIRQRVASGCH